ncbi:contact-dependent growth inhibition system immunity protein [Streptomyces montanisoli]|uniref:CdiI immunity protein domain-containing protein n=1 Tax=Streptomyces montanisoli TaxID=2798581 RepID=A0A940RXF4_9ACTN|nr:contact-dependent growth inhibition system immunity protein [Streptomyces montanisoli]MBP0461152.1 hypothetical protein [Streptomyces montanisoli]
MPLEPLEHDRHYGELDQVVRAFMGHRGHDEHALTAYLRHTWHTRPWALGVAEQQLRTYAANPPGRLRRELGEFYDVPNVGLPGAEIQGWLLTLADRIRKSIEAGQAPPLAVPATHWEWQARFPELTQFLGGWFSQDMPDEFAAHEDAVADYTDSTDHGLLARLAGEIHELLALPLDDAGLAVAAAELGLEMDPPPPHTLGSWLLLMAETVASAARSS